MSKKKPGKKGPDPIELPKDQILQLAQRGWMFTAIAAFFKVSTDTLYRRVSAAELQAAKETGTARLWEAGYTRAMGGRIEKKNPDGSITVTYLQSSDRMLRYMLDRSFGRIPQTIEINPNPQVPANVSVILSDETVQKAIANFDEKC